MDRLQEKMEKILAIEDSHEAYIAIATDRELSMDDMEKIVEKIHPGRQRGRLGDGLLPGRGAGADAGPVLVGRPEAQEGVQRRPPGGWGRSTPAGSQKAAHGEGICPGGRSRRMLVGQRDAGRHAAPAGVGRAGLLGGERRLRACGTRPGGPLA